MFIAVYISDILAGLPGRVPLQRTITGKRIGVGFEPKLPIFKRQKLYNVLRLSVLG